MALIMSFDPGGTTGVAVAEHSTGRDFQLLHSLEFPWQHRFSVFNLIYLNRAKIKALVIEEFRLFENKTTLHSQIGSEMPSCRVIGIIELSAQLSKLDCIYYQKPSNIHTKDPTTGKFCYTLSIVDAHKKLITPSKHCLDAYMHLRYFILTQARKKSAL